MAQRERFEVPGIEPLSLAGKRVVISGGSTGIGRATALLLASKGAHIFTYALKQEELDDALRDLRKVTNDVYAVTADQSRIEEVRRVFQQAEEQLGGLDILINNAAQPGGGAREASLEEIDYIIRSNLLGYVACAHEALQRMIARGGGHIVNIGSMSANVREEDSSVYVATKAGVQGFSEALRKEANRHGIKVTNIEPGQVGTSMGGESPAEQRRAQREMTMLKAEDVADAVLYCLTRPQRTDVVELRIRPHQQVI